jgi:hypothetical protein
MGFRKVREKSVLQISYLQNILRTESEEKPLQSRKITCGKNFEYPPIENGS